jgi:uncharacterized lipoprotein NlpE involved in copper resistance
LKKKTIWLLILTILVISGCNSDKEQSEKVSEGLPVMWVIYQGEKYTFESSYSSEQVDIGKIISTNTFTDKDDGFEIGKEIYQHKQTGEIYVLDNSGSSKEWIKLTKK